MTPHDGSLEGRRILITGASRGLGRALAVGCAARGAEVVLLARNAGALQELGEEIRAQGAGKCCPVLVELDLRERKQVSALGEALYRRLGGLEGVVLNAARLGSLSPLEHIEPDLWREVFAVNVEANFWLLRSLHPLLLRSGRGVVVGVTCAVGGRAFWGGYGASKVALEAFLQSYRAETRRQALAVCCIDPGAMSTRLRAEAFPGEPADKHPITDSTLAPFLKALQAEAVPRATDEEEG